MHEDINALRSDVDKAQSNIVTLLQKVTPEELIAAILTVDGAGTGLDADKLDGNEYSDITTALATKLNSSAYTAADVLAKLLTQDGSGSGLDADKLDGLHIGHRYITLSSVTAGNTTTYNTTISQTPSLELCFCFVHGGIQGYAQISGISGTTYTVQYKFDGTGTNRQVNIIYFY